MPKKSRTKPRTTVTLHRELHELVEMEARARQLYTQEQLDQIVAAHYGIDVPPPATQENHDDHNRSDLPG